MPTSFMSFTKQALDEIPVHIHDALARIKKAFSAACENEETKQKLEAAGLDFRAAISEIGADFVDAADHRMMVDVWSSAVTVTVAQTPTPFEKRDEEGAPSASADTAVDAPVPLDR